MKFLVFQHVPHEHPGLIKDFADKNNIDLDIVEFWKEFKIPRTDKYRALIIMGGPMGVYEKNEIFPSKNIELAVIKKALGKIPILGFCLGSQLLACALDAKVYPNFVNGKQVKEIGYYDITLTKDGKNEELFRGFPEIFKVLQWHGDAFDLPENAKLLATSPYCRNQAFSFKNAYGLLFHFEFTPDMVKKQIDIDNKWIHKDFELNEEELILRAQEYREQMKKQSELLLNNFLTTVKKNII